MTAADVRLPQGPPTTPVAPVRRRSNSKRAPAFSAASISATLSRPRLTDQMTSLSSRP